MNNHINVLIVDDHKLFRNGLELVLQSIPHIKSIQHAGDGKEALLLLTQEKFRLVFLDISMPILNGLDTAKAIVKKYKDTKLIVLSMHQDKKNVYEMYDAGVSGYLLKSSSVEEINRAVNEVSQGKSYFVPEVSEVLINRYKEQNQVQPNNTNELSGREIDILKLICGQLSNQEIADKLFISSRTVETYRENLLKKTKSRNTAGLVVYALRNDLIDKTSGKFINPKKGQKKG